MPSSELPHRKQALRASMRKTLRGLGPEVRRQGGGQVAEHLRPRLEALREGEASPPVVAFFASLPWEIDTTPLDELLRRLGVGRALPAYRTGELTFHRLEPGVAVAELPPDRMGIPTPPADAPVVPVTSCALVVAPGLAFDDRGFRLGQGGGYYDRALAAMRTSGEGPMVVGICLDLQRVPEVPRGPHDQRVDAVCSPAGGVREFGRVTPGGERNETSR